MIGAAKKERLELICIQLLERRKWGRLRLCHQGGEGRQKGIHNYRINKAVLDQVDSGPKVVERKNVPHRGELVYILRNRRLKKIGIYGLKQWHTLKCSFHCTPYVYKIEVLLEVARIFMIFV